ncbi:unnamed protein product [Linum trigynum]|uniref:Uncharacterized protein n=1 Tax=Linum trigynum TaxID=586398 RepID=A0AAV2GUY1_9ROSI
MPARPSPATANPSPSPPPLCKTFAHPISREAHNDAKHLEVKLGKDALVSASSQMTWKEPKEYNRGKRYSESPNTHADPWHTSRYSSRRCQASYSFRSRRRQATRQLLLSRPNRSWEITAR